MPKIKYFCTLHATALAERDCPRQFFAVHSLFNRCTSVKYSSHSSHFRRSSLTLGALADRALASFAIRRNSFITGKSWYGFASPSPGCALLKLPYKNFTAAMHERVTRSS